MLVLSLILAPAAPPAIPVAAQHRIRSAIEEQLKESPSTGAAVGVVRDGKLVYTNVFGFRNLAHHQPVNAQTQFEIGSVTKQFTAAAILQLKEAGRLSLDDSLAKYLPSFPHASELTLRDLLNQVSGLPNYGDSTSKGSLNKVEALVRGALHFPPDTKYQYSNTNYYVLGQVIRVVSGQPYEDYVRQHLFAPAGMDHSG